MLTIGQLARMFNITPKTLRHYDAIELFMPSQIGEENGYRYYALDQLPELRYIVYLRSLGIGIDTISNLKQSGALDKPERIRALLEQQAMSIQNEIMQRQEQLRVVVQMVDYINGTGGIPMEYMEIVKPAFRVVGLEWKGPKSDESIPQTWQTFNERAHEIPNIVESEIAYGVCISIPGDDCGGFRYIAAYEVSEGEVPAGMTAFEVPTQKYAVFTHVGSVDRLKETYDAIYSKWLPQNGLNPVPGVDMEVYGAKFMGPHHESSETQIYIPVAG
ncbi:hypothetical protein SY83_07750 [Paenibacillus swuensis]|uniref:HTH merR-type domain-containing protein n=2 Tax=Paenibacillus swuensis TaxID=1178515 RepID=A0A172TGL8_9BACL|nr:hypothetical protein SY83_07750 [Paenibacillus swuensis]